MHSEGAVSSEAGQGGVDNGVLLCGLLLGPRLGAMGPSGELHGLCWRVSPLCEVSGEPSPCLRVVFGG